MNVDLDSKSSLDGMGGGRTSSAVNLIKLDADSATTCTDRLY